MLEYVNSLNISDSSYINALIVMAVYIIAAFLIDFLVQRVLKRIVKFTKSDVDDKIVAVFHKPIFFLVIGMGLMYSLNAIEFKDSTQNTLDRVVQTLLTIIWSWALIKVSNIIIEDAIYKLFDMTGLKKDVIPLIKNVSKVIIIASAAFALLIIWDIDYTPLLASAGILSAVVAFAAKDTISNFFGGISVFVDKPYKIGDYIELDQGRRGEVVEIGMRSTRIKTRDDILISIPNSIIVNSQIVNESAPIKMFRIRIPIGVSYGSDIDLVEKVLEEIANANENVIKDPEPRVRFRKFGDSSLDFELLCWAGDPSIRGLTLHELNKQIYKRFAESGISIPFPQRDLHIKNENN